MSATPVRMVMKLKRMVTLAEKSFVEIDVNATKPHLGGDGHRFMQIMMCTEHFAYLTFSKRKAAVHDGKDATIPMFHYVDGLKGI
jgi:hypothetical protein